MHAIVLEIPQYIAFQLKLPPARAQQMLMEEWVLRLDEQGILTAVQGAALLKMTRLRFEQFLAEHDIPLDKNPGELEMDVNNLEHVRWLPATPSPWVTFYTWSV